jgi:molybdopterin synthase catalytic subunit
MLTVRVQAETFDIGVEMAAILATCPEAGAVGSFLGVVRSTAQHPILAMTLEHYPAMTQRALQTIAGAAAARFDLLGCTIIHRFGRLLPREPIVLVLAAATHRQASLDATHFLIDWLKTSAPFWKQEHFPDGSAAWVAAHAADDEAASRWSPA